MAEEKRSYILVRDDGFVVHTKPITGKEAEWLYYAYEEVEDRSLRARYLAEWGNVLDAGEYVERLRQLSQELYYYITRVYKDRQELEMRVSRSLSDPWVGPEAKRILKELAGKIDEFLRRPVKPRPVVAPVRYIEMGRPHVTLDSSGGREEVTPRPELYTYVEDSRSFLGSMYGVSVFRGEIWLWSQYFKSIVQAVIVRRDATDGELVDAMLRDEAVQGFVKGNAKKFEEVISKLEDRLRVTGREDALRKIKVILTTAELLGAGRREGEGVPA